MSSEFVKIKFDKDNSNCLNLNRDYSDICAICRISNWITAFMKFL